MKITVIPNTRKDDELFTTARLIKAIGNRAEILMDKAFNTEPFEVTFVDKENLFDSDVIIVLGGDGTILRIASDSARKSLPVLGINLGRRGFMSEVEVDDIENAIDRLLSGDYTTEKRMMLKAEIKSSGIQTGIYHALNDIVILKAADAKLISTDIFCGSEKINEYVCDGLIIATPTGSTGYSLSAGGPVINPNMELLAATPICAHMLNARPMIIPFDPPVKITLGDFSTNAEATVTLDGHNAGQIHSGDEITISRSEYYAHLIRMGTASFYDTMIQKLQ